MRKIITLALSVACTSLFVNFAHAQTENFDFDSQSIKKIEVNNQSGLVKITGQQGPKINITIEKINFDNKCKLQVRKDGDEIEIDVDRTSLMSTHICQTNITVTLPPTVEIDVENGSGDVHINQTSSEIDYKIGSGNITIDGTIPELEGKIGSGNANVKGLTGEASIMTGSGNVELTYSRAPQRAKLDLKSGSGNVKISLPKDTRIDLSTLTGAGSIDNDFTQESKAGFKISFKSGSGNLEIRKQR